MPRIWDFILNSAIYLYPTEWQAQQGDEVGGSGFLVGVSEERQSRGLIRSAFTMRSIQEKGAWSIYAATAAHVIGEGASVVRFTTASGGSVVVPLSRHDWLIHPDGDDVAICPLGSSTDLGVAFIPEPFLVTPGVMRSERFGPGDDVFFVGRFISMRGSKRTRPPFASGISQ